MWKRMHVPCASPHAFHLCFRKVDVYLMLSHLPGRHCVGKTLCEGWHSGPVEGRSMIFTVLWAVRNGYVLASPRYPWNRWWVHVMVCRPGLQRLWYNAAMPTKRWCLGFDCMEKNGTVGMLFFSGRGVGQGKLRDSWGTSKRSEAWNTKGRRKHGRFWLFFSASSNCLGCGSYFGIIQADKSLNFWSTRLM